MEEILEAGLDLVLAEHAKRKGLVSRPRKEAPSSDPESDHIPAHVKRAVWIRDGGCCQFRMEDGSICGSTFQVEFDHVRPRALGGPSTIENVRLACRLCRSRHNLHYADCRLIPRGSVEPLSRSDFRVADAA